MKEVTMITTCEIISIAKVTDEEAELIIAKADIMKKQICNRIKSDLNADDVNMLKNQVSIRD